MDRCFSNKKVLVEVLACLMLVVCMPGFFCACTKGSKAGNSDLGDYHKYLGDYYYDCSISAMVFEIPDGEEASIRSRIREEVTALLEKGFDTFLVGGAVGFDTASPQDFTTFLGFTVRVADKTPDAYPQGQDNTASSAGETGCWHAGDVMEVLVRGGISLPVSVSGTRGGKLYIRKSDGVMTGTAGESGTTVCLENCRVRAPRTGATDCCEAVVNKRNIL